MRGIASDEKTGKGGKVRAVKCATIKATAVKAPLDYTFFVLIFKAAVIDAG